MWRYVRRVHPWYFLVITVVFGTISLVQLRRNNEGMIVRREAVYQADKNNGDVEGALRELREYVYSHMNTSLTSGTNSVYPPIQLQYTYERRQAEQQARLGENNSNLYYEAQRACDTAGSGLTASDTIACIENYTASRGVQMATIPDALYKFDFMSAKWTPDLAGWSLVIAIFGAIGFVVTSVLRWLSKRLF